MCPQEKTLVTSPQAELLSIKDLIEGGTSKSGQFVDLVPGHYPTMSPESPSGEPPNGDVVPENTEDVSMSPAAADPEVSQPDHVKEMSDRTGPETCTVCPTAELVPNKNSKSICDSEPDEQLVLNKVTG